MQKWLLLSQCENNPKLYSCGILKTGKLARLFQLEVFFFDT